MRKWIQTLLALILCVSLISSTVVTSSAKIYIATQEEGVVEWEGRTPEEASSQSTPKTRAEANCFLTGSIGSAESTGICGGISCAGELADSIQQTVSCQDGVKNLTEAVTDKVTWTLKDGVLTLSGNGPTAMGLHILFQGNEHIETVIIGEGITNMPGLGYFQNVPNLKTVIFMDAGTYYNRVAYNCPNLKHIIVGTNLKDSIFTGGVTFDFDKTILLSKNVASYSNSEYAQGITVRNDCNVYTHKTTSGIFITNGIISDTSGGYDVAAKNFFKYNTVVPYNQILANAQVALADVPASVLAKLPAELFEEPKEEPVEPIQPVIPVEPVKPTEPVVPEEIIPETMTGTNDFTNAQTHLRTSYSENNYVDISVSGNTLTVSGRLLLDGLTEVQVKCGSKKENIKVTSGELFSAQLTLSHSGKAAVNVYTYRAGSNWSITYNRIYIEKTANGYRIMPSLVQENNTAFEQSNIDPQATLNTEVPASVVAMSNAIVGGVTDDYTKVFLLHKWVAENIYYDYDALYGRSQRITDSAGVLEARRSVCEGYSRLLKDLILAQGIPAIYCTNLSTDGSYAISTSGGELHAHAEAYVDGRWIAMDATWDSRNKYRSGTYTTKAPAGYYYFDISSEAFAMDHKILSRGEVYCIPDENGFGISTDGKTLLSYSGTGGCVLIPEGVTIIYEEAFSDCSSLTGVSIPSSMELIDLGAFENCSNLAYIYYEGTKEQWQNITIAMGNESLGNAEIHFGVSEVEQEETGEKVFTDVSAEAYYADSVAWAVDQGITNGTSATTFSPDQTCTTAQILTFLWRACGSPEATENSTFTDVAANAYYSQAAQWAKELCMVEGSVFSPNTPCTRAATVWYMWQAAGCPTVTTSTVFADVPADADYATAVAWALENGITTGTSAATFSPDSICSRGQIATFLYRALAD